LTVAKTFALAISKAAQLHPAAEPLIAYASLLAPEPIPLFLFSKGLKGSGEPFASNIADGGIDDAVAALRAFALVYREQVRDERNPSIEMDCIRLHRLVRLVADLRWSRDGLPQDVYRDVALNEIVAAFADVYPKDVRRNPEIAWRLFPHIVEVLRVLV